MTCIECIRHKKATLLTTSIYILVQQCQQTSFYGYNYLFVRMNVYISNTSRAKAIKFGDYISEYGTQIKLL